MVVSRRRITEMAHDIANTIEHGECLYSAEGIDEIKTLANELVYACEQYSRAVQDEEVAE